LQDYIIDTVLGPRQLDRRGIKILDLGCGVGYTLTRLSRLLRSGSQAIGIDIEPRNVEKAIAMVEERGDSSKVEVYTANVERTTFDDNHFDIVVANLSFSVFENSNAAASQVARILKPGGELVVSEVSSHSFLGKMGVLFDRLTHNLYYALYSPKALAGLLIPVGLRVENMSRIPLAVKIKNKHVRIPSTISPLFHIRLLKPHRSHENGRVN
jgi:ubiquinone/menaquinone biosynthesis C-methylase UbiE